MVAQLDVRRRSLREDGFLVRQPGFRGRGDPLLSLLFRGRSGLASLEARLTEKPKISVPAITLDGLRDPLKPGGTANPATMFKARHEHRVVDCGHNLPWEPPRLLLMRS
jgi:pimeloyl-ACP methyl ester carboxylesterase